MKKIILLFILIFLLIPFYKVDALSGCLDYGIMAYEDFTGYCKCMSGYVMDKNFLGQPYCVSGDSYCFDNYGVGSQYDYLGNGCVCRSGYVWGTDILGHRSCVSGDSACRDDYGYGASYDSLTKKCECSYGYIFGEDMFGKTKCVTTSQYCQDKYGYNSSYNFLSDSCECGYGYELTLKTFSGGLECVRCLTKYGLHSSYNSLTKKCECDDEYTLDDNNQCVKKQNNVYFKLIELDTDNKKAVIKSEYDYKYYLVEYRIGCYDASFKRYVNKQIIVNLGTDFKVDRGDKIVLQDDNENCEIKSEEKVDSDFTLFTIKESYISYTIPNVISETNSIQNIPKDGVVAGIKTTNNNVASREKSLQGVIDKKLTQKLKGKILLQVESAGESWYVNPKNSKKYYMANGNEAFNIMRYLGVGITNKDLEKIKTDKTFAKKNSGKIFLQVEAKGEAYYIDFNGVTHYLKDGAAAYTIMRELGLGITNNDIRKIDISEIN